MKTRYLALLFTASILMAQDLPLGEADHLESPPLKLEKVQVDLKAGPSTKDNSRKAFFYGIDTPPNLANFFWGNQGNCVVNTNPDGTVTMFHPGQAGVAFNWCMIVQPLPAPPYTAISCYDGHIFERAASLSTIWLDVFTGKFVAHSTPGASDSGAVSIAAWKMNNFTTYAGSAYYTYSNALVTGGILPECTRIRDGGTGTRTYAVSHKKEGPWLTIHAVPSGDFITPNFFGYALRGSGNGVASMMTIYHESVTTP